MRITPLLLLWWLPNCGAIVHGTDADPQRYPYFSSLDRECGGALIAPDIVLTAGHCKPTSKHVKLHVGTYYYDDSYKQEYQEFKVMKSVRHPEFQRLGDDEFRNDFTILQLDGMSSIPPIPMNRNPNIPSRGQDVIAMGLGTLEPGTNKRPDVLQQAQLTCISNEKCGAAKSVKRNETFGNGRIVSSHLCTFVIPDNDRDGCAYDSGGPIVIPNHNNKNDLLVGLVSWGIGCADPVFPGVNARVSSASDWIDEMVCQLSSKPPRDFHCGGSFIPTIYPIPGVFLVLIFAGVVVKKFCDGRGNEKRYIKLFDTAETQSFNSASSSEDGRYNAIEFAEPHVTSPQDATASPSTSWWRG